MFDSVWAACPKCGTDIEFQSKAGVCECKNYRSSSVPEIIATSLDGAFKRCKCGNIVTLEFVSLPRRVRMNVLNEGDDASYD